MLSTIVFAFGDPVHSPGRPSDAAENMPSLGSVEYFSFSGQSTGITRFLATGRFGPAADLSLLVCLFLRIHISLLLGLREAAKSKVLLICETTKGGGPF